MFQMLFSFFALLTLIIKRILAQPWLALASVLGLSVAAALTVSVPLYADASYHKLFEANLVHDEADASLSGRPPMEMLVQYPSGALDAAEWDEVKKIDSYMTGSGLTNALGLP